jgi:predicted O-methyltransferase YrrM
MDQAVEAVLAEYERRAAVESELMRTTPQEQILARIDEFLICVGPDTGKLLHLLVTGARAKTILELGTSYGYSTVWLADAARATSGRVHSLERLARAGLADYVEFHVGSALDLLPRLAGPFDFVLVDLWKNLYCPCLELFHPKLAPGALVVADNMLQPATARADAMAYQELVRRKGDMDSVMLPIGSGIELSRKR